eukprot:c8941_g1_i1.p1 GENE.c8941_g1_i1~~c8941_g1_i1.p1  ORF type:complete len:363 (+),score=64.53 c8941_g1_i1:1-1089(+)
MGYFRVTNEQIDPAAFFEQLRSVNSSTYSVWVKEICNLSSVGPSEPLQQHEYQENLAFEAASDTTDADSLVDPAPSPEGVSGGAPHPWEERPSGDLDTAPPKPIDFKKFYQEIFANAKKSYQKLDWLEKLSTLLQQKASHPWLRKNLSMFECVVQLLEQEGDSIVVRKALQIMSDVVCNSKLADQLTKPSLLFVLLKAISQQPQNAVGREILLSGCQLLDHLTARLLIPPEFFDLLKLSPAEQFNKMHSADYLSEFKKHMEEERIYQLFCDWSGKRGMMLMKFKKFLKSQNIELDSTVTRYICKNTFADWQKFAATMKYYPRTWPDQRQLQTRPQRSFPARGKFDAKLKRQPPSPRRRKTVA